MGHRDDERVDGVAYADVYAAHRDHVAGLAYLLLGDHHTAEDVTADAFAKVYPRWRRGQVRDPRAYLRRTVANEAKSRLRRRYLERAVASRRTGDHRGAREEADTTADRQALWEALGQLAPAQRTVLVLRYFEDLSEAETAEVLGCSVGTVKSRAARGIVRLERSVAHPDRGRPDGSDRDPPARAVSPSGRGRAAGAVPPAADDPSSPDADRGRAAR